jgi:hypothetical protein
MTFLLFLASVAILEYLVRGTGQKSGLRAEAESTSIGNVIDPGPVATETATSDLLALGHALNAQRSGKSTDCEQVPEEVRAESGPKPK